MRYGNGIRSVQRGTTVLAVLCLLAAAAALPAASAQAPRPGCEVGVGGCIPTPEQCGTGNFNGHWSGPRPGALAVCAGGAGHVVHYTGGDASIPCGAVITSDVLVAGSWGDPNQCFVPPAASGFGVPGSRFAGEVRSRRGVVAAESVVAAEVGRRVLKAGGNAVDAAVATVLAAGVARPEMCGIGGRGFLLYRGADGTAAALDFFSPAPAAFGPGSMDAPGIDDLETGHRVVGVPGVVAGMAAAVDRFGSMPLAQLVAPAERLAREGVRVTPEMADAYGYQTYPAEVELARSLLPLDPVPGKPHIARLRLFPASAEVYLQAGGLPYPAGARLIQTDYANALAMIMRDGPDAFYRGPIARLIDAEMRRSRTASLPGGAGLLTYDDLARYRPVWRQPLAIDYRGTTVLGTPPPSASMLVMEALQLLEGFDLAGTKHSSADHLHLFAEAQKLATADFEAYAADPAFEDVPTDVLLSEPYAARRRALIDQAQAGAPGPGSVQGSAPGPAGAPAEGHTLHVSVVDRRGNAVAVTCSIGTGFGSAVVAPGTGFLLNSTNGYFNADGHPNHAEPGKRPATAQTPLIVVRDGVPILVAGAAGGGRGPAAVAHAAVNVVDFGMTLGHAVDAARAREPRCCDLFVEQTRIPSLVLEELERRGHSVSTSGEYEVGPWVEVAGVDPRTRKAVAAADPRGERGAAGA